MKHTSYHLLVGLLLLGIAPTLVCANEPTAGEPFDYSPYQRTLAQFVDTAARVDYRGLKRQRRDLDQFIASLNDLKREAYDQWSRPAQIAFWVNAYNAFTLQVVIDHYPIKERLTIGKVPVGIRHIPGVWRKKDHKVMSKAHSLGEIEHRILRGQFRDPRIHLALVCASKSCPPLRREPYLGATLDQQLRNQLLAFAASGEGLQLRKGTGVVELSWVFKKFGNDFIPQYGTGGAKDDPLNKYSAKQSAVLRYLVQNLPKDDADFLRQGGYRVRYLSYDWSLNDQND